jgi:hypothetical protein
MSCHVSKPYHHAVSSARRYGGKAEDYLPIHDLMDSSKIAISDNRHRVLTHNSWFIGVILERVFGTTITNSDGKTVPVKLIGEQHVLEDFANRFIPSPQDYIVGMENHEWFSRPGHNGSWPESYRRLREHRGKEASEA